jgi:signal transduction histidine kinase
MKINMIFRNISLKNKLIIIMMGISLLLVIFITAFFSYNEYKNQKSVLINELNLQTKLLSEFLVAPLIFNDTTMIKSILSKMNPIDRITQIIVYDSNFVAIGFYHSRSEKILDFYIHKNNVNNIIDEQGFYAFTRPIYFESKIIGYIHIGVTKRQYYDNLYNYAVNTLLIFGVVIFLAYLATLLLQKIISKPIEILSEHLKRADINSPSTLHPIAELKSNDEFNILYKTYNLMVTKLVQDYNEIDKTQKELILANEIKTKILQNMSHELRTPLNGIIGNAAFLLMSKLGEDDNEMVNLIYRSSKRLQITFESLISLSQFENNEVEMALSRYNLAEYIQNYYPKIDMLNNKSNLHIQFTILDQSTIAYIDPDYFSQALFQLIDNAVKFTTEGYVDIQVDSRIVANTKYAIINIIDTGIGISQKDIETVFEVYKQASEGLNRKYEGIGIGLTLARKIVRMHSGEIEIISEIGKGSIFKIVLPFATSNIS